MIFLLSGLQNEKEKQQVGHSAARARKTGSGKRFEFLQLLQRAHNPAKPWFAILSVPKSASLTLPCLTRKTRYFS